MQEHLNEALIKQVATSIGIKESQVESVLALLNDGNTVPFIARYRKEHTGGLDEEEIQGIHKEWEYGVNLAKRKLDVIRLIDEKGMLTEELKTQIETSTKLVDVEDLYRPYKEKKKTKATEAIALGLEPLAKAIMTFPLSGNFEALMAPFVNENVDETKALEGAKHIIAEWISDDPEIRKWLRAETFRTGVIRSKLKRNAVDEKGTYEMYHDYNETLRRERPYRVLAINRAESENILNVSVEVDKERVLGYIERRYIKDQRSFVVSEVNAAIEDGFKRLLFPSIEREVRAELKEKAEDQAISIFASNLRKLLLQPPMKGKMVLGIDPAFRTGCKLVIADPIGRVLAIDVIYPHEKYKGAVVNERELREAKQKIKALIKKNNVDIIAIGNGTASRETESFIAKLLKDENLSVSYLIVNEAGASVYSASELAREEFPDLNVEERSAASIARRLQDPLSELVKIDPKSIGVGQYQHDVAQNKLNESLTFVVTNAVNQVGVNVNTASKALLMYVSGLNKSVAENIVKFREENGTFQDRKMIKKVPKLGAKTYEQSVGFLRIPEAKEPFDMTSIHPESYKVAEKIAKKYNIDKKELGKPSVRAIVESIDQKQLALELGVDKFTLSDILDAFIAPLRDPRDEFEKPLLRSDVLRIEDLEIGMELSGTVRNVVDFGAFVDCGVKEDGLVHISKLSHQYVKHPLDVVSVGDIVTVWVEKVDLAKGKLSLTMLGGKKSD